MNYEGRRLQPRGLLEVSPDDKTLGEALASEGDGVIPFDYVWFTPRVDLVDACERFRELLQQMRARRTPPDEESAQPVPCGTARRRRRRCEPWTGLCGAGSLPRGR